MLRRLRGITRRLVKEIQAATGVRPRLRVQELSPRFGTLYGLYVGGKIYIRLSRKNGSPMSWRHLKSILAHELAHAFRLRHNKVFRRVARIISRKIRDA